MAVDKHRPKAQAFLPLLSRLLRLTLVCAIVQVLLASSASSEGFLEPFSGSGDDNFSLDNFEGSGDVGSGEEPDITPPTTDNEGILPTVSF